jgi:hypothetical protein
MESPTDTQALYYRLCMAAEEYTSFRNSMQVSPAGNSPAMIEAALQRADKVATLLRQLRERQAVSFVTGEMGPPVAPQPPPGVQAPQPPPQQLPPQPQPPPQQQLPSQVPPPPGAPAPQPPPQSQPVGPQYAWKCSACGQEFSTPTPTAPTQCPHCGVQLAG